MKKLSFILSILLINLINARTVNVFNPTLANLTFVVWPDNTYTPIPSGESRNINLQNVNSSAYLSPSTGKNPKPAELPGDICYYMDSNARPGINQKFQFTNANNYILRLDGCQKNMMGNCVCYVKIQPG